MSVIVIGMSVPGSCNKCRFSFNGWCWAFHKKANGREMSNRVRADWCPLRALPEKHGRLIDADALMSKSAWYNLCGHNKSIHGVQDYEIASMETIVEAGE